MSTKQSLIPFDVCASLPILVVVAVEPEASPSTVTVIINIFFTFIIITSFSII